MGPNPDDVVILQIQFNGRTRHQGCLHHGAVYAGLDAKRANDGVGLAARYPLHELRLLPDDVWAYFLQTHGASVLSFPHGRLGDPCEQGAMASNQSDRIHVVVHPQLDEAGAGVAVHEGEPEDLVLAIIEFG